MQKNSTLRERLQYWFDNQMGRGTIALIQWLGIAASVIILILSGLLLASNVPDEVISTAPWHQVIWLTFMHAMDSGYISGDSGSPVFIIIMLIATLSGMFLLSALIGLINAGIEAKLEALRRGRSRVLESDHTVILGWSPHVLTIIQQLSVANESRRNACIAILADRDKVEMEEEIRALGDLRTTRVVCRSGNPSEIDDLGIVSPETARAVIIPPPSVEHPDILVIKTILALVNREHAKRVRHNIVTAINDPVKVDIARVAGQGHVRIVLFEELIARLMAQTCRQSGLSVVYSELLQYEGSEFYFVAESKLAGKTFHEAMFSYEESTVIGLLSHAHGVRINPDAETVIASGDELILLADDDSTIRFTGYKAPEKIVTSPPDSPLSRAPERLLFVYWNRKGPRILRELDRYVKPGSHAVVVGAGGMESEIASLGAMLVNLTLSTQLGDPTHRDELTRLQPGSFDHIILLADEQTDDSELADAKTLTVLLLLRDLLGDATTDITIVSEMHDARNRELASIARADDFIVSSQIDSMLLTQISENERLAEVFDDLFDADGSEIYLKPVEEYFAGSLTAPFASFREHCMLHRQLAIGYRLMHLAHDKERNYGVRINPVASVPVTLGPGDKLIVISDD